MLVFGIFEAGTVMTDAMAQRQAVREAARQAVVGRWPSVTCTTTGSDVALSNATHMSLLCYAKGRAELPESDMRVYLKLGDGGYAPGQPLAVCAQYPMRSASGFFAPLVGGRVLRARTVMRIESLHLDGTLDTGGEDAHSSSGWSWCTT
jgi:hypothetical protein